MERTRFWFLLLVAAIAGAAGAWISVVGIVRDRNFGSLLALLVAVAGAYIGALGGAV